MQGPEHVGAILEVIVGALPRDAPPFHGLVGVLGENRGSMYQLAHVAKVGLFGSQQLLHVQAHDVVGANSDLGDFTHLPRDLRGYGRADLRASDFEARHGIYHGEHACARIAVFGRHARASDSAEV